MRPTTSLVAVPRQTYLPAVATTAVKRRRATRHLISAYNLVAWGYYWRGIA